ncbi:MAG: hypothetical protein KJ902_03045 [Candidatus Omnitrophica bacterium]|nr:hypothetical protein [Candidatus Omnitrophota bacterium]MBU4457700.1 hypothetical protein [Candidatus Omnitrophota bacterium]
MEKIKTLLKNEAAKKVLLFFNENPHSIDTAKGISIWAGCDVEEVEQALDKLVKNGALINHKTSSINAYSYTTEKAVVKKIERLLEKLH